MIRQLIPLAVLLAAVPAQARSMLEVQGRLQDAAGRPLSGTYLLNFSLMNALDGSKREWQEARYVRAVDGNFSNILGDKSEIPEQLRVRGYRLRFDPPAGTGWTVRVVTAPAWSAHAVQAPPAAAEEEAAEETEEAQEETRPEPPAQTPPAVYPAPQVRPRADDPAVYVQSEVEQYKRRLELLEKAIKKEADSRQPTASIYVVQRGDTLRSIAQKLFGNSVHWIDIYRANSDRIRRGGELVPGQRLLIPKISE